MGMFNNATKCIHVLHNDVQVDQSVHNDTWVKNMLKNIFLLHAKM